MKITDGKANDRPIFDFFLTKKLICLRNGKIYASLKTRLIAFTILSIIIFEFSTLFFLDYISKIETTSAINRISLSFASVTVADVKYALENNDTELLNNALDAIRYNDNVSYGIIYDADGEIIASYGRVNPAILERLPEKIQNLNSDLVSFANPEQKSLYTVLFPIVKVEVDTLGLNVDVINMQPEKLQTYNRRLGVFVYGISTHSIYPHFGSWRSQAIMITFWFILLFSTIAYILVQQIVGPTRKLLDATYQVAEGNFNIKIPYLSNNELGLLGDSFNMMVQQLERSQKELEAYTTELETRVYERTRELSRSEEQYRTLFQQAGNALVLVKQDGTMIMSNENFHEFVGMHTAELQGQQIYEFFSEQDAQEIQEIVQNSPKNGSSVTQEFRLIGKSGMRIVNLLITFLPQSNAFLYSFVDVSEFKEMQHRLIRSEHLIEIGELSASVAHEIRNPLGAISTSIGVLDSMLNPQGDEKELMKIILEEAQHLDKIISNFLQFAHLNESAIQETNIGDLILTVASKAARHQHIRIFTNIKDSPTLMIDCEQIQQALTLLVTNSLESIKNSNGHINILSFVSSDQYNQPKLSIQIEDNGDGIDNIHLANIFKPFYSTKMRHSGMGLAICDRIVQNHGGVIKVNSTRGAGSVFTITLPMNRN